MSLDTRQGQWQTQIPAGSMRRDAFIGWYYSSRRDRAFADVHASACGEFPSTIYIHGIGEHPPKEQWKREWDLALFGKPLGDRTTMAYWSDILHGPAPGGALGARAIRMQAVAAETDSGDLNVDSILSGLKVPA